jgi:hypothetical protein
MKTIKFVCSNCGGTNIEMKAWVDANTQKYKGDAYFDDEDSYCNDCEEHTGLVTEDEFNSSITSEKSE